MNLAITSVVQKLTCPAYVHVGGQEIVDGTLAQNQGEILHAMAESYLKGEPVLMAFNLLFAFHQTPEQAQELKRMACNLLSFADILCKDASAVSTEALVSLRLAGAEHIYSLYGYCDCLITRRTGITVVDWKPRPRADGLDELQVRFYLAAALTEAGAHRGEWLVYYYRSGQVRKGSAGRDELNTELSDALQRSLHSDSLRPGIHCVRCVNRKECVANVCALD